MKKEFKSVFYMGDVEFTATGEAEYFYESDIGASGVDDFEIHDIESEGGVPFDIDAVGTVGVLVELETDDVKSVVTKSNAFQQNGKAYMFKSVEELIAENMEI